MRAEIKAWGRKIAPPVTKEVAADRIRTLPSRGAGRECLRVDSLRDGESIVIETRNSLYRLVMLDRTEQKVIVRGGKFFIRPTEAYLLGSAEPGHIYLGSVVQGRGLGIALGSRCFITSPVTRIEREAETARTTESRSSALRTGAASACR